MKAKPEMWYKYALRLFDGGFIMYLLGLLRETLGKKGTKGCELFICAFKLGMEWEWIMKKLPQNGQLFL